MPKQVIILGAGGHGKVLADLIIQCGWYMAGFLDDNALNTVAGFPVLGKIADVEAWKAELTFLIGIGNNVVRQRIDGAHDACWHTAIHPTAVVAREIQIDKGSVILANAVINTCTKIGRHCIINTGAVVEHDNRIGDYTHIAPHAALGGNVTVGNRAHIGIGAVVRNGIHIADDCVIGAGAVVVKDINEPGVYIGVPARRIDQL